MVLRFPIPSFPRVRERKPDGLGERWQILETGLSIKKYPTCYCTHRAIDGALDLVQDRNIRPEDVASVGVTLSENFATILRNHRPQTGLAAKFSIEFAMACAIVARKVGLPELTDSFVQRPDVQAVMERVETTIDSDPDPVMPGAVVRTR